MIAPTASRRRFYCNGSTSRFGMLKIEISMKYPKTAGKFLRFFDEKVPE
jgi:hypothetical protein